MEIFATIISIVDDLEDAQMVNSWVLSNIETGHTLVSHNMWGNLLSPLGQRWASVSWKGPIWMLQSKRASKTVRLAAECRILCADISKGQENFPVPVVCDPSDEDDEEVDEDELPPGKAK